MPEPEAIPFAEWTPDLSDRQNPTAEAKGVFSIAGQYAPFPDIQNYGPAATLIAGAGIAVYLPFDGADASTDIIDEAPGSTAVWTAAGNAQIDTAESVFGGASLRCDGVGDWVSTPDSASLEVGSGDWTLRGWFKSDSLGGVLAGIIGKGDAALTVAGYSYGIMLNASNNVELTFGNGTSRFTIAGTTAFTSALNPGWHHFAGVRSGNTAMVFVDGVLEGTQAISGTVNNVADALFVGALSTTGGSPWDGWIDDVSIIIGTALYTATFTPPSVPLHFGSGAEDVVLGADTFYDADTDPQIFFGDDSRLYHMVSRVAEDVSKAGGYSAGASDTWQFAQFGDFVIAVTEQEDPQVYQMAASADFADLTGSPPTGATSVARIGDFVWMGKDFTVHWSAFGDHTDWVPDPDTQAGNQVLDQERGQIMCLVGLDYAAIFQERAIRRAIYVGPPVVWDFGQDYVEKARGAISRNAAVPFGRVIFFAADDGFYAFDGQSSTPIGYGKVDAYFSRNLNYGFRHKVSCGIDYLRKLFVVGYPSGSAQNISDLLIFSIQDGRWTHDVIDLEFVFDTPAEPFTVDNFSTLYPEDDLDMSGIVPDDIDAASFDDRRIRVGAFQQTTHQLGLFVGSPRAATIDTREFEPAPGRRGLVTEIWPMGDYLTGEIAASVVYRAAHPGAAITVSNPTQMNRAGFCPARIDARFMRARLQITAGAVWRRAEGVHATAQPTGGR